MNLGDRLVKVDGLSVFLSDNCENNHFILDRYKMKGQQPTLAQIAAANKSAWAEFTAQFPNADKSQFFAEAYSDDKGKITGSEIFLKGGHSVSGSDRKYWSPQMKAALGLEGVEGFPYQLSPLRTKRALPIPAVHFTEAAAPSLKKIFNNPINIYVRPESFFVAKFREIFQQTRIRHNTAAEAKRWLGGPNMSYWPQQLNFAVFCARQGCGISREIFDSGLDLSPQVRAFYRFHVYFTVRRILFQMGGIQSISALPGDPTFNLSGNRYDVASYKRICADMFGIDPTSDFRFTSRKNGGLGDVYIGVSGHGPMKTGAEYPGGFYKFADEGGKAKDGNLLAFIELDGVAFAQYDWFAPNKSSGLTQAGLARINQSIEAFVYCILGAQVNVRSSIIGTGGRAKEAQTEFLTLLEDAIRQPDLAKSVQRYQLAVDEANVRLNLAVCPGAWLMPASMIINTKSTVGYNNRLKQAVPGMKLGVNNDVNSGTKKVGIRHMEGGPPKINPPNSHPSNPIHKAAMAAQNPASKTADEETVSEKTVSEETPQHVINKTAVIVGGFAFAALLLLVLR